MIAKLYTLLFAAIFLTFVAHNIDAEAGGPDNFGYTFKDSNEADGPEYDWIDISSTGAITDMNGDSKSETIDLGFNFIFYGKWYNQVFIGGDNGYLKIGDEGMYWTPFEIPTVQVDGTIIAPLWEDWQYCPGDDPVTTKIYYETKGEAPNRYFVVLFENMRQYGKSCSSTVVFEAILYEATGNIVFQYEDVTASSWDGGASVGIQKDPLNGLSYAFGEMDSQAPLAVEFYAPSLPENEIGISDNGLSNLLDINGEHNLWIEIENNGIIYQENINLEIEIYSTNSEYLLEEDFDEGNPEGWSHGIFSGTHNGWGTGITHDYYNRGKEGEIRDGNAMSAGRKGDANNSGDDEQILSNSTVPYDSWLQMPNIDMTNSVGGTLSFSHTWGFYYIYEGAYLEASTDDGDTWQQVHDFTKGGYSDSRMSSSHYNPYDGLKGWTHYSCTHDFTDVNARTDGEGEKQYLWDDVELNLDPWSGQNVDFRWRVAYNTDWDWYVNSWYRLDDVSVELVSINNSAYNNSIEEIVIDERGGKTKLDISSFIPKYHGLSSGDTIAMNITLIDSYNDEYLSNNNIWIINTIKFIFFKEDFETNLDGWTKENPYGGNNLWNITTLEDLEETNHFLYSEDKRNNTYPGSTAIVSPSFSIPDTDIARMEYWHSVYFWSDYDGAIVQISIDGGNTWETIKPILPKYCTGFGEQISDCQKKITINYADNPLLDEEGWGGSSGNPLEWTKVEYNLTEFNGESDVKIRWHVGWSNYWNEDFHNSNENINGYFIDDIALFVENITNIRPNAIIEEINPDAGKFDGGFNFIGSSFDTDGEVIQFEWKSNLDGLLNNVSQFSLGELTPGTHIIEFRVMDNYGTWSEWALEEVIALPNSKPEGSIISISESYIKNTELLIANSSALDLDGHIIAHEWYSSIDGLLSIDQQLSITNLSAGNHMITYRCQDNNYEWSILSAPVTLYVSENLKPLANIDSIIAEKNRINPIRARYDENINFSGSGEDYDGDIIQYYWIYKINNSTNEKFLSNEKKFTTTIIDDGIITICFKVKDNNGIWSEWNTREITILPNTAPIALIYLTQFAATENGYEINLAGSGEDDKLNGLQTYEWKVKDTNTNMKVFEMTGNFTPENQMTNAILENKFLIGQYLIFSLRVQDTEGLWSPWEIGEGIVYIDDGDGVKHSSDAFPFDKTQWSDSDNDGYGDNPNGNQPDVFPNDYSEWIDTDGDGIGDNADVFIFINNYYIYTAGIGLLTFLFAAAAETWYRDTTNYNKKIISHFIKNGVENQKIIDAGKNMQDIGNIVLFSTETRKINTIASEMSKMKDEMTTALENVSSLNEQTRNMEKEGINVENFIKKISELDKELLKQAKNDFGDKYIDYIKKDVLGKEEKK